MLEVLVFSICLIMSICHGDELEFDIIVGFEHSCILYSDKITLRCWGTNDYGQLGYGDTLDRMDDEDDYRMGSNLPNVDLGTGDLKIKTVALGHRSSCVLFVDGSVKCWGRNVWGEIGFTPVGDDENLELIGDQPDEMGTNLPFLDFDLDDIIVEQLESGGQHVCGLFSDNQVRCWGENAFGNLGVGSSVPTGNIKSLVPINFGVEHLPIKKIYCGYRHCAVEFSNGKIKFWGSTYYSQLGVGHKDFHVGTQANHLGANLQFTDFQDGSRERINLILGRTASCMWYEDNGKDLVRCAGLSGLGGYLGLGVSGLESTDPGRYSGDSLDETRENMRNVNLGDTPRIKQIALGRYHICVLFHSLDVNQSLKCFGHNKFGDLGLNLPESKHLGALPEHMGNNLPYVNFTLPEDIHIVKIGCGYGLSCAQFNNSKVKCWGDEPLNGFNHDYGANVPGFGIQDVPFIDFTPFGAPTQAPTVVPTQNTSGPTISPSIA